MQFILAARYQAQKHIKNKTNMQVKLIDVPEKAISSFTEASIRYSECCQKLIDAYPEYLNSNLFTGLQQFHSYIGHKFSATKPANVKFSHAE